MSSDSLAGRLLVATPLLVDPNFHRTVVLMLQHDEEGTLGVVLNRPSREAVADHLPDWKDRVTDPGLVNYGGPVDPEVAIGLSLTQDGEDTGVPGLSIVDLSSEPPPKGPSVQIYSGYAGWGAGQLESELASGSWYVVQAAPDDPFAEPTGMWSRVLRRQAGHLAIVSTFPDDPSLN
ncbi:MAG: YqgE/AlgH family protein [Acidimicrobiia bacterium]|nr:YqgE/AlgH family protein [Acidimicrobiia bacterium]